MSTDLERRLRGYAEPDGPRPPRAARRRLVRRCTTPRSGRLLLAVRADGSAARVVVRAGRHGGGRGARPAVPAGVAAGAARPARTGRGPGGAGRLPGRTPRTPVDLPVDLALATAFQREVLPALRRTRRTASARRTARWPGRRPAHGGSGGRRRARRQPAVHRAALPPRRGRPGALTGYAGGLAAKAYLLDLEAGSAA